MGTQQAAVPPGLGHEGRAVLLPSERGGLWPRTRTSGSGACGSARRLPGHGWQDRACVTRQESQAGWGLGLVTHVVFQRRRVCKRLMAWEQRGGAGRRDGPRQGQEPQTPAAAPPALPRTPTLSRFRLSSRAVLEAVASAALQAHLTLSGGAVLSEDLAPYRGEPRSLASPWSLQRPGARAHLPSEGLLAGRLPWELCTGHFEKHCPLSFLWSFSNRTFPQGSFGLVNHFVL